MISKRCTVPHKVYSCTKGKSHCLCIVCAWKSEFLKELWYFVCAAKIGGSNGMACKNPAMVALKTAAFPSFLDSNLVLTI